MALEPLNIQHALQIQAGIDGRKKGHQFEAYLTELINNRNQPFSKQNTFPNVVLGNPIDPLLSKALSLLQWDYYDHVTAIELGSLATSENGKNWLNVNGVRVTACKSDILLTFVKNNVSKVIGVSVKQCNTKSPTNAQLYFTTAQAFVNLLNRNNIKVSQHGVIALKQFCGEPGYRPMDNTSLQNRLTDPRRYFWEEVHSQGKEELEYLFSSKQNEITQLLLQKAYLDDPFVPEVLIHKTKKIDVGEQEYAVYTINELVALSKRYAGFYTKNYSIYKGTYPDPQGVQHEAPRFGIVQMQRGGQKQHPTQLQFNLQAGYFYKI